MSEIGETLVSQVEERWLLLTSGLRLLPARQQAAVGLPAAPQRWRRPRRRRVLVFCPGLEEAVLASRTTAAAATAALSV